MQFINNYQRLSQTTLGMAAHQGIKESFGIVYDDGVSQGFLNRKSIAKQGFAKGSLGAFGGMMSIGYTAYEAYNGYQRGGIWGAAKGVGNAVLTNAVINVGLKAAGMTLAPLAIGAAVAGVGYGVYKFGQKAGQYGRSSRNVEMGGGFVDTFGTASTMRQRSLAALQNTHVNGRMALGAEAQLIHNPMMR